MNRIANLLVLVAFVTLPLLARRLNPNDYTGGRSRDVKASAERNTSAIARMLGEFRTDMSDVLFIKTERYLHSGVAYQPHMDNDTLSTAGTIKEIDTEHAAGSTKKEVVVEEGSAGEAATIIPSPEADWRGFIGALHRKVKPWRDASEEHVLTDGREMLPWFRVMTMSDPHYTRGYAVGAWWLKRRNFDAAVAFAQEGIAKNPDSFEIPYALGQIFFDRAKTVNGGSILNPTPEARELFLKARDAFQAGAEQAFLQRPPGWTQDAKRNSPSWDDSKDTDASGVVHMAVLTEKEYGDPQKAAALARRYLPVFPDDPTLKTLLK